MLEVYIKIVLDLSHLGALSLTWFKRLPAHFVFFCAYHISASRKSTTRHSERRHVSVVIHGKNCSFVPVDSLEIILDLLRLMRSVPSDFTPQGHFVFSCAYQTYSSAYKPRHIERRLMSAAAFHNRCIPCSKFASRSFSISHTWMLSASGGLKDSQPISCFSVLIMCLPVEEVQQGMPSADT